MKEGLILCIEYMMKEKNEPLNIYKSFSFSYNISLYKPDPIYFQRIIVLYWWIYTHNHSALLPSIGMLCRNINFFNYKYDWCLRKVIIYID
jgi:hypothetical protein